MFEDFFEECPPDNGYTLSDKQKDRIKSSLKLKMTGSRSDNILQEEKNMKTSTKIRTFLIAATVAAMATASVASASTEAFLAERVTLSEGETYKVDEIITNRINLNEAGEDSPLTRVPQGKAAEDIVVADIEDLQCKKVDLKDYIVYDIGDIDTNSTGSTNTITSVSLKLDGNSGFAANTGFPLDAGDDITIDIRYEPTTAKVNVGLIHNGNYYYDTFTNGHAVMELTANGSGYYYLCIENNSVRPITISGSVIY